MNDKVKAFAKAFAKTLVGLLAKFVFYVFELWMFAMATLLMFAWTSNLLWGSVWFGGAVTVILAGSFFLAGLRTVPPVHKGILSFFGFRFRLPKILGPWLREGPHWIFPFLFRIRLIPVEKRNIIDEPQEVYTHKGVQISPRILYTYIPWGLIAFENSGGNEGVQGILDETIINSELRLWAIDFKVPEKDENGNFVTGADGTPRMVPGTWIDILAARNEAVHRLLKTIHDQNGTGVFTDDDAVKVQNGQGMLILPELGIAILRFTIGTIGIPEDLAADARLEAREVEQQKGQEVAVKNFLERVEQVQSGGKFASDSDARDIVQVTTGEATKEIVERRFVLGEEERELVGSLVGTLSERSGGS